MSDVAIRVENLGKLYRIGKKQERYKTLRDTLNEAASTPLRWFQRNGKENAAEETIWALKDVSFEIKHGEVVGIIGRNGAGKSTLLKILSRITEPTEGQAILKGRVGSLLEVGTGFHPELTGRENVYLNGAILGMKKAEIDRKFDEIVAFAEVVKFIDTPVKHYSSGMHVRLAFAVAAHLEPEILLVDEVLAVGDAAFQKKCLGKMGDVAKQGRTVLFVSHNMAAVKQLCTKGIVLRAGCKQIESSTDEAINYYLHDAEELTQKNDDLIQSSEKPQFKSLRLLQEVYKYGDTVEIEVEIVSPVKTEVGIEIEIHDERGAPIIYTSTAPMAGVLLNLVPHEANRFTLNIGPLNLATGEYSVYFWLLKPWIENYQILRQPLKFSIDLSDPCDTGFDFRQSYSRGAMTVPIRVQK